MKFFGIVQGGKRNKLWDLVAIRITMLNVLSEIWPLVNKLWADFDKIVRIAVQWYKEQLIKILGWSGSSCWLSNRESGQYGGNELPWPRRSALSEWSCGNVMCTGKCYTYENLLLHVRPIFDDVACCGLLRNVAWKISNSRSIIAVLA